jgi:hypothetical protein
VGFFAEIDFFLLMTRLTPAYGNAGKRAYYAAVHYAIICAIFCMVIVLLGNRL